MTVSCAVTPENGRPSISTHVADPIRFKRWGQGAVLGLAPMIRRSGHMRRESPQLFTTLLLPPHVVRHNGVDVAPNRVTHVVWNHTRRVSNDVAICMAQDVARSLFSLVEALILARESP